jgi:hypothetical protein
VLELAEVPELAGRLVPEPDVPAPDEPLPGFADAADVVPGAAEDAVVLACAALASPAAMPPPARTLAAPIVAVMARSRPWPRSRAATAARTVSLPVSTPDLPSAGPGASSGAVPPSMPGLLLRGFCLRSGTAVTLRRRAPGRSAAGPWGAGLWTAVWMTRWKATGDRG